MSRIAYVNGRYIRHGAATIHIEDRGFQFADGVYEVVAVVNGKLVDDAPHMVRLDRSLRELAIDWPVTPATLGIIMARVVRKNRVRQGIVYVQITRGIAPRNHQFPADAWPSLVLTARAIKPFDMATHFAGVDIVTTQDNRWKRCDIKSVSLLPNVLNKQFAVEKGAYEAWMIDGDGYVTEGTASNAWIVTGDNKLVTRDLSNAILSGITRRTVLALAAGQGITVEERAFHLDEAKTAREAFVTSTTSFVKPAVRIDGQPVGLGEPGPLSRQLLSWYADHMRGEG